MNNRMNQNNINNMMNQNNKMNQYNMNNMINQGMNTEYMINKLNSTNR